MTLGPLGVRPGSAVFVAALYLIEIATRYTCDGAAEAGARLGDVSTLAAAPAVPLRRADARRGSRPALRQFRFTGTPRGLK